MLIGLDANMFGENWLSFVSCFFTLVISKNLEAFYEVNVYVLKRCFYPKAMYDFEKRLGLEKTLFNLER